MKSQFEKEVFLSWERCIKKGLPIQLSFPQINFRKDPLLTHDNTILISIFEQSIKNISSFITSNHVFLFTDPDGTLLAIISSKITTQAEMMSKIETGTSFSEESIGTNAISLAIKLKQPVYLLPEHHYCHCFKKWYCYTVPLYIWGDIKGYLDVSTIEHIMKSELIAITKLLADKIIVEYKDAVSPIINKEIKLNLHQLRILKLLTKGLTTEAIALETGISVNTVRYHKKQLFKELDVQSASQAVAKAINAGLIR